ncbi:hypothetical protein O181_074002 [Austropuccinia psidii MF-1]|uniref:Uncharacterized protein n=1 Tax=Austropuccinia psidii MF-1 TaxID=1389203 RepID=A0A9Q3FC90_9BASI|nr:hypothetical protein [Austropuccinia psidii MF-1]
MESLTACGSLEENLLTGHPTVNNFHDMGKDKCDTGSRYIAEAKGYNKKRYDKTNREPDFREGDQVKVSPLSFLKLPKKIKD